MIDRTSRSAQSALFAESEQLRRDNNTLKEELASLRRSFAGLLKLIRLTEGDLTHFDEGVLLNTIIESALQSIEASDGSVLLIDHETEEFVFAIVAGQVRDKLVGHRIPVGTGIAGWVAKRGEPVIVPNVNLDPRFSESVDRRFQFKTNSLVCVPLIYNNHTLGVLQGVNKMHGKSFTQPDVVNLQVVGHMAAWAISVVEAKMGEEFH